MVNCWAVSRCRGHVQGADGCPFAHHGYLLAPPMFWACVLALRISDLVICPFGIFLHLVICDLMQYHMNCELSTCGFGIFKICASGNLVYN